MQKKWLVKCAKRQASHLAVYIADWKQKNQQRGLYSISEAVYQQRGLYSVRRSRSKSSKRK